MPGCVMCIVQCERHQVAKKDLSWWGNSEEEVRGGTLQKENPGGHGSWQLEGGLTARLGGGGDGEGG